MKAASIFLLLFFCTAFTAVQSQEPPREAHESFQQLRTIGFASTGMSIPGLFTLQSLTLLLPLSDNTELHVLAGYSDENVGISNSWFILDDKALNFQRPNAAITLRVGGFLHTEEVSGFAARLGAMTETTFIVPGTQGPAQTIARASFGSGSQRLGVVAGFTWSIHPRFRLGAYYWLYYYRVVRPESRVPLSFNNAYEKLTGIYTSVLLELAVKPF